jgi:ATP-binding cassette subfamily F protein 3
MLNILNMTFLQGGQPLFQQANLQVFANQRIGLVGQNGCGKSTLFRLIRGELHVDSGEVSLQSGKTLAFVEQEIENSSYSASWRKYSRVRSTMWPGSPRNSNSKR